MDRLTLALGSDLCWTLPPPPLPPLPSFFSPPHWSLCERECIFIGFHACCPQGQPPTLCPDITPFVFAPAAPGVTPASGGCWIITCQVKDGNCHCLRSLWISALPLSFTWTSVSDERNPGHGAGHLMKPVFMGGFVRAEFGNSK